MIIGQKTDIKGSEIGNDVYGQIPHKFISSPFRVMIVANHVRSARTPIL